MFEAVQRQSQPRQGVAQVLAQCAAALRHAVQRQAVDEGEQAGEHGLPVDFHRYLIAAIERGIYALHRQIRIGGFDAEQGAVLEIHHLRVFQRVGEFQQARCAPGIGDLEVQVALAGQLVQRAVQAEAFGGDGGGLLVADPGRCGLEQVVVGG
ncbi:hypothetical protein D9M73_226710 [compost metagenome]